MIKTYLFLLFSCLITTCLLSNCSSSQTSKVNTNSPEDTLVQIPTEWVKKLSTLKNVDNPPKTLVSEFYDFLYPNKQDSISKIQHNFKPYINPLFVNLDETPEHELLLWIGSEIAPLFAVLKQFRNRWYLVYGIQTNGMRTPNHLFVYNLNPGKKLFYIETTCGWGSGFSCNRRLFYRIEQNQVRLVLSTINFAHYHSMGNVVNKQVKSHISISSTSGIIFNHYYYKYLPGSLLYSNPQMCPLDKVEQPVLDGEVVVGYKWNAVKKCYELTEPHQQQLVNTLDNFVTNQEFYATFQNTLDSLVTNQLKKPYTKKVIELLKEFPNQGINDTIYNHLPIDYYQIYSRQ